MSRVTECPACGVEIFRYRNKPGQYQDNGSGISRHRCPRAAQARFERELLDEVRLLRETIAARSAPRPAAIERKPEPSKAKPSKIVAVLDG